MNCRVELPCGSHRLLHLLALPAAGRGDLPRAAALGTLLGRARPRLQEEVLVGFEETVLSGALARLPTGQLAVALELALAGLPVLGNGGLGAEDALEHLHVALADAPVLPQRLLRRPLLPAALTAPLPPLPPLVPLLAAAVPAEGSFGALVDLGELGADLIVGGAVLVAVEGGEGGGGGVGGGGAGGREGGAGGEELAVVLLGEELGLEGALAGHVSFNYNGSMQASLPLEQAGQPLLDLALSLPEVDALDALVELLDVRVLAVLLEVEQRLDHLDQVALLLPLQPVHGLAQLELVAGDGLAHEVLPVAAVDALDVELALHVAGAELDVLLVSHDLRQDDLEVRPRDLLDLAVLGTVGELGEIGRELERVGAGADVGVEALHVVVGLLADDEERDAVVGVDVVQRVDVRGHVLEDEHDVVAAVQVQLLVALQRQRDLLLLLVLLHQFLEVHHRLLLLHHLQRLHLLLLVRVLLRVDQVLVDLHLPLVEVPVVVHAQLRSQPVDDLPRLLDQRVVVDLLPADPRLGVHRQAAVDEVPRLVREVHPAVVRTHRLDLLQNVEIADPLVGVLPVEQLVVDHAQRPDVRLEPVRLLVQHLGGHRQTRPQDGLRHVFGHLLREAQISDLADAVAEEDVGDLEIAVHGIDLVEALEAVDDLLEKGGGLVLSEPPLFVEVALEVAAVAVLHDDEDAIFGGEVVDEVDNVLVLALLEHTHLGLDQLLQLGSVLHELLGDDLDCHLALVALVDRLVHHRPRARPQRLQEVVRLELRPLQLLVLHSYTYTRKLQVRKQQEPHHPHPATDHY